MALGVLRCTLSRAADSAAWRHGYSLRVAQPSFLDQDLAHIEERNTLRLPRLALQREAASPSVPAHQLEREQALSYGQLSFKALPIKDAKLHFDFPHRYASVAERFRVQPLTALAYLPGKAAAELKAH